MESKITKKPSATLTVNNKQLELPVYGGSVGPDVIDIRKLYSDGKVFTYDPGFTSTASCESQIAAAARSSRSRSAMGPHVARRHA